MSALLLAQTCHELTVWMDLQKVRKQEATHQILPAFLKPLFQSNVCVFNSTKTSDFWKTARVLFLPWGAASQLQSLSDWHGQSEGPPAQWRGADIFMVSMLQCQSCYMMLIYVNHFIIFYHWVSAGPAWICPAGGQFPAGQCTLLVGIGQAGGYPDQSKQQVQREKNTGVRPTNIPSVGLTAGVSDFMIWTCLKSASISSVWRASEGSQLCAARVGTCYAAMSSGLAIWSSSHMQPLLITFSTSNSDKETTTRLKVRPVSICLHHLFVFLPFLSWLKLQKGIPRCKNWQRSAHVTALNKGMSNLSVARWKSSLVRETMEKQVSSESSFLLHQKRLSLPNVTCGILWIGPAPSGSSFIVAWFGVDWKDSICTRVGFSWPCTVVFWTSLF